MAFEAGQRVGDYEIVSTLGAGGMGCVYRVRNIISNRTEAMKVLLTDSAAEPRLAARFLSEIRTLAVFDHPNIAQLHTAFQADNQLVMVMEFVEGSTLEQRASQGLIPQDEVIGYILQVLSALSYAHSRGVVHRDVKPANVMVTPHGVAKLMDFGIAKSNLENNLTRPGATIGSMNYMSPEQVRGANVDARSDLYSLGVMLYELLAGQRPFESDTTYVLLDQQLNAAPRPPVEVNPNLSDALNEIILTSMAKDPAQRFQNADAFRNALQNAAKDVRMPQGIPVAQSPTVIAPAPAYSHVPVPPPPSSVRSHRGLWISLGAVAVLAISVAAGIVLPRVLKTNANERTVETQSPSAPTSNSIPSAMPSQTGSSTPIPAMTTAAASGSSPSGLSLPQNVQLPMNSSSGIVITPAPGKPARANSQGPGKPRQTRPNSEPAPSKANPTQLAQNNPPPPPAPAGPSQQELGQARDELTDLNARASAVASSVETLRRQQNADGLDLRQDMAGAYARMNSYLGAANADLNGGNLASARSHMDKAEKEITTLEKFFGK